MNEKEISQIRSRYEGMTLPELEHARNLEGASALHQGFDFLFYLGSSEERQKHSDIRLALALSYGRRWIILTDMIKERRGNSLPMVSN